MLIGIIGKPNVGKSTFFKALTLSEVEIANYPFATIKPNHGIAYVRVEDIGKEFGVIPNPREGFIMEDIRFVPVEILDVAGLVPGASEGKGLGNQFLDDLRQADVLIHIIDASGGTNEKGEVVEEGTHNPLEDVKFIERELDLWYMQIFNKVWDKFVKQAKSEHIDAVKAITRQFSGLKINEDMVKSIVSKLDLSENLSDWGRESLEVFVSELRKISKPMIIAANKCDSKYAEKNIEELKRNTDYIVIPTSAVSELALKEAHKKGLVHYLPGSNSFRITGELSKEQEKALEYIRKNVLERYGSTGVQEVIDKAVFEILGYIAVFPAGHKKLMDSHGNILPDCFLMPPGSTALDFARRIHEDIAKNFIKAIDARTGKALGKDYILKHRDALEIVTK